ncbi:MAG: hypothetical protein IKU64_05775 [Bacteroides sp.]|nr:hypothetical protein [Bacteroides sp.]
MKKKIFAIYALVGALVASPIFTSCVEDTESASVTALRGAKAEQLKSIATLNNAKAQAETTLAQAEAAYLAAEAAQKQALADLSAAEAKIKELEAQMAKDKYDAELAAALAQAQANKLAAEKQIAYYQGEMEKSALALEKDLIALEKQLMDAQKELADKKDDIAKAEYQKLKELTDLYGNRLVLYTQFSQSILEKEAEIAATEAELADWEVVIAEDIAEKEKSIEWAKYQIETLKKYTNYTADIEAMKEDVNKLYDAYKLAQDQYQAANKAYNALNISNMKQEAKVDELREAIWETNMGKFWQGFLNYSGLVYYYDVNPIKEWTWNGFEIEKDEYTYYNHNSDSLNIELEYKDVREFKLFIDNEIAWYDVEGKKEAIDKKDEGFQALYDAAVKATAEAKKAWDAVVGKDGEQEKKQAYQDALSAEKQAENNLKNAQDNLEWAEEGVEALNLIYTLVSDPKAAEDFVAAVKAYNEAIVAIHTEKAEAYFAKEDALKANNEALTEYNTLSAVYNGQKYSYYAGTISLYDLLYNSMIEVDGSEQSYWYSHAYIDDYMLQNIYVEFVERGIGLDGALAIDNMIKALEEAIENLEEEIEELKDVTAIEQALEIAKIELANMKNYQLAMKAELDATKAELDALQAKLIATEEEEAA